jgi:hypothetical protein
MKDMKRRYITPTVKIKDTITEALMGPGGSITPPSVGAKEMDGYDEEPIVIHHNVWDE